MRITKDEAYILSAALSEEIYNINDNVSANSSKAEANANFKAIEKLQIKLEEFSEDKRRKGRTSMNAYSDIIKRVINKYK